MRTNEIKEVSERVIRVEYIAEDGKVFYDIDSCKNYELSAMFVYSKQLKRLTNEFSVSQSLLLDNYCEDCELEIFDIQTKNDLDNLRNYLYYKALNNGSSEESIQSCFTAKCESRKQFTFDNVTMGHEVLIFWSYDDDWFWVYNDGSLNGFFDYIKSNYITIIDNKGE